MTASSIPTNPLVALVIALLLFAAGRSVIGRVTKHEPDQWLERVLTACLVLHLLSSPVELWVVDHIYGGVDDWVGYDHQGAILASGFRHFDFSLAPAHFQGGIVSEGIVGIVVAVVFVIIGTNQIGAFLVFSWLAFIGIVFFYRAFTTTFAGANTRRYGYLVCFLPTLIFWTSDVSKEALMLFLLGLMAYGSARVLANRPGGFPLIVVASVGGAFVRPNEWLLAVAGLVVALAIRQSEGRIRRNLPRRVVGLGFVAAVLLVAYYVTNHYLPGSHGSVDLNQIARNNGPVGNNGPGFGSSYVGYSSSVAAYPTDVYTVLFDPLPVTAHGRTEWLAAAENTFLVVLVLTSLRRLWRLPRIALARPYVLMCMVFVGGFLYAFASLSNLGLIARERTVMLPFLLVALAIPVSAEGQSPYEWELSRWERLKRLRLRSGLATEPVREPSRSAADEGVGW